MSVLIVRSRDSFEPPCRKEEEKYYKYKLKFNVRLILQQRQRYVH